MKITFDRTRETKGTWLYVESSNDADLDVAVGSLYLKKPAVAAMGDPAVLVVTVEAK